MQDATHTTNENVGIKGVHLFEFFDTSSPEANAIETEMNDMILGVTTFIESRYFVLQNRLQAFKTREIAIENLIPLVGRSLFAQRLVGTLTYTGIINYGALGTATASPTAGSTQLGTEVFRKVPATATVSSNVATIRFFFTKADTNGTYNEWGVFIDGTASANTGQMFSHLLTGGWTKSASETMTVLSTYTIS